MKSQLLVDAVHLRCANVIDALLEHDVHLGIRLDLFNGGHRANGADRGCRDLERHSVEHQRVAKVDVTRDRAVKIRLVDARDRVVDPPRLKTRQELVLLCLQRAAVTRDIGVRYRLARLLLLCLPHRRRIVRKLNDHAR